MTWMVCLLLWMQPAQPPQLEPEVTYDQGPLRGEVTALFDARYWYSEDVRGGRPSELRMQLRIAGEKIDKAARVGHVIFDEAVDDTGQALIGPDTYTDEQKTETRPLNMPAERLRATGLLLPARIGSPARSAKTLTLRGHVRLILADEPVEVMIDDPLSYVGEVLEHPQLEKLGLRVRVVAPDQLAGDTNPPPSRMLVLDFGDDEARIHGVTFHDAWMKPIRHRPRPVQTKDNRDVQAHVMAGGELDQNSQLVLQIFPEIEDKTVPISMEALELP